MDFEPLSDDSIDKIENSSSSLSLTELHNYRTALEEELRNTDISSEDSPDEIRVKARKFAIQYLPMALKKIATLAETADKDSVQLAAARTIWNIASAVSVKDDGNPVEELFRALEAKSNAA